MPSECFDAIANVSTHWKHAKGMSLRYGVVVFCYLITLLEVVVPSV